MQNWNYNLKLLDFRQRKTYIMQAIFVILSYIECSALEKLQMIFVLPSTTFFDIQDNSWESSGSDQTLKLSWPKIVDSCSKFLLLVQNNLSSDQF